MVWYYDEGLERDALDETINESCRKAKKYSIKGGAYLLLAAASTGLLISTYFSDLSWGYKILGDLTLCPATILFAIASLRNTSKLNKLTEKLKERTARVNKLENSLK